MESATTRRMEPDGRPHRGEGDVARPLLHVFVEEGDRAGPGHFGGCIVVDLGPVVVGERVLGTRVHEELVGFPERR